MTNPLNPSPGLLAKLGSIIVHADEGIGPHGHEFDMQAMRSGLSDPDVKDWLHAMELMAMVPKQRNAK